MVKSADRFFKGFSLEGYKLQILVNALEKERKQCLNRLKEEKHIFKMSIKAPVKCGEECWSQYGEIFHANGDKRDNSSITKMYVEQHKDENLNLNSFSQDSRTSSEQKSSSAMSGSMNSYGQMSPAIQGSCFQIIRDRNSCREKNGSKIKITNPPSLSLLEILCADIENGAVVGKRTQNKPYSHGTDLFAGTLGHRRANQTRITEQETLVLVPDNGIIKKRGIVDGHEEPRSSKSTNRKTTKSQDSEKSNCNSFEGLSSDNSTPQKAPISKRYLSCQDTSFQGGSSKSGSVFYELEDGRDKIQLKRTGKEVPSAKGFQLGLSTACARTIEGTCVSSITCSSDNATPESRISNYKFPQFEDGGKSLTRKSKKQKYINLGKRKLSRTSYSGIRLFQVEDLQSYQRGNSQEGIDKQTRDKMDEFFAKVERTKCFQKDEQRWRCVSGVESIQRRNEKKSTLEIESRMFACKNGHGYRRAKPWPTQVWS